MIHQIGWVLVPQVPCPQCFLLTLERSEHIKDHCCSLYIRCTSCGHTDGWTPEYPIYYSEDCFQGRTMLVVTLCKTSEVPIFARKPVHCDPM